jgi:hypothetical protein
LLNAALRAVFSSRWIERGGNQRFQAGACGFFVVFSLGKGAKVVKKRRP